MVIRTLIVFFAITLVFHGACKKENSPSWTFCDDCSLDEWVGDYEGAGDYYNGTSDETELGVPTIVKIENTSGDILRTTVTVVDRFTTSFTSSKNNNDHYYSVPGSDKSLDLSLSKNGDEYKLSGTVKLFHFNKDTLVVDQSISFDAFK